MDNELDGKIIRIDEGFTGITGYTWEDVKNNNMNIFNLIPEYSREEYMQIVYQAQKIGEAYLNHEILCKDGHVIAVNCYGEVYKDDETGHSCSKILIIDVTEQEKAVSELNEKEEQLAKQMEKIKFLTENAQEIFVDYDIQRDYFEISRFMNGQYEIFIAKENYFNSPERTIHDDDFLKVCEAFLVAKDKKEKQVVDFRSKLFLGNYNWYRMIYTKYINPKTGKSHIIGRVMDINDEKMANLMLVKDVDTDHLTGIYNRTATEKRINDILSLEEKRNNHTMLLIDIDHFKQINDTLGYGEGDIVLEKIGNLLSNMFRQDFDILGRVDGDAFVAFVRNTSDVFYIESQCKEMCERLKRECSPDDGSFVVTVSIGIALGDNKCDTFKKLYKKADKALQRQLNKGRDGYSF